MGIHFTRFDSGKSVGLLSLYYHEFMEKVEERKGKKYLMVYGYLLDIWLYEIDWHKWQIGRWIYFGKCCDINCVL